ncbi:MAG TPA: hypothetical protein VKU41_27995 [Polyangiaceae bacterium]|nr:hypothetical protein [Polyangiaceae bacterium]
MDANTVDRLVRAWIDLDRASAPLPADAEVIESSRTVRSLIVEALLSAPAGESPGDDFLDACAVLGRLIADRAGSPTLASLTMGHAFRSIPGTAPNWQGAATGSVAEGFAGALVENVRQEAMQAWDFPNCAVPLGLHAVAIAAGHPSDDDEVLAAWAGRVATAAARAGIRQAVVAGAAGARAAVVDALTLVGIETRTPG